MSETRIEWTDQTWSPLHNENMLMLPLKWRKQRKILVGDLFGELVTDEQIDRVFAVICGAKRHTFQVLTKRADRMLKYLASFRTDGEGWVTRNGVDAVRHAKVSFGVDQWPLPNVWLGVSVENQDTADARIPLLLKTPASKRFVSYEPALEAINWTWFDWHPSLSGPIWRADWIIVGGESGPGARPFNIAWARNTIEQCKEAGVACFVNQLGAKPYYGGAIREKTSLIFKDRKGSVMSEWPEELRIREFPR
jgi:protein gp37